MDSAGTRRTAPAATAPVSSARSLGVLALLLAVTFAAPATGALFPPGGWYEELNKPAWTPPGWLFGPVWTALYLMMALAAWLVWRRHGARRAAVPLALYGGQLALNAAWTPLFFGMGAILWALLDLWLLWAVLSATVVCFFRFHRPAGWLLVPYLAWVTFAGALNFTLWRLNP